MLRHSSVLRGLLTLLGVVVLSLVSRDASAINVSGGISTNTTWTLANSPYVMTDDVVVQSGATLTIEAGVVVEGTNAASGDVELTVAGGLVVNGTVASPVTFRAASGSTTAGYWQGIELNAGATATLANVVIQYADIGIAIASPTTATHVFNGVTITSPSTRGVSITGASSSAAFTGLRVDCGNSAGSAIGIEATSTATTLTGSRFERCNTGAVVTNASSTVTTTVFANNTIGHRAYVSTAATFNTTISRSTFYGHTTAAVRVQRASSSSYVLNTYISTSIFENNALVLSDSSTSGYATNFGSFNNNVWSGTTQFSGNTPASTAGTLRGRALFVDAAAGDFTPTDRSPARYLDPDNPALTIGAIDYDGDLTGAGIHGYWYESYTWPDGSTVDASGDVVITPGVRLTFRPNTRIRIATTDSLIGGLDPAKIEIRVEGELIGDGTTTFPIRFESAAAVPARGDWYGIVIPADAEAFGLAQVDIGHAYRGVSLYSNNHIVRDAVIHDSSDYGVWISGGTPTVRGGDLRNNQSGLYAESANVTISDTDTFSNTNYGAYLYNSYGSWTTGRIYDNGGDGLRLYVNTTLNQVFGTDHLTIANNAGDGVDFGRASSSSYSVALTLYNAAVTHNTGYGVRESSTSGYQLNFTCGGSNVWGNSGGSYAQVSTSANCVAWNPLYVDLAARNYAPSKHSPHRGLGLGGTYIGALPYAGAPASAQLMGFLWDGYTFSTAGSPHAVAGDLWIPSGAAITFEPGSELRFASRTDGMQGGLSSSRSELRFLTGATATWPAAAPKVRFTSAAATPTPGDWSGLYFDNVSAMAVRNAEVRYADNAVYVKGTNAPTFEGVDAFWSDSTGFYFEAVSGTNDVDVLACISVGDGTGTGVYAVNSSGDVRSSYFTHHAQGAYAYINATPSQTLYLINNTFVANSYGLYFGRNSTSSYNLSIYIYNNVISASATNAVRDISASGYGVNSVLGNNNYYNSSSLVIQSAAGSNHITSNPLVEDDDWNAFPRWWDPKLWTGSLAINAGTNSAPRLPSRDLLGRARTINTTVDIGAVEHDPAANQEPRADAVTASIMVPRGEAFTLNGAAAFDPDGTIASSWWTMSDGTVTPGQTVQHTFTTEGSDRWAYITVVDNLGAEDHARVLVNVNIRPVADAGVPVFQDAGVGETVDFFGTLSYDPDGTISSWRWDFGDGSPVSTQASPSHSYLVPGLYTVTLTVTDNEGLTSTDTTLATVYGIDDTLGPLVTHTEIADNRPIGVAVVINAEIQDISGVGAAVLWYRAVGSPSANFVVMTNSAGTNYTATIPGAAVTAGGVEYWIEAVDNDTPQNTSTSPLGAPVTDVYDFTVLGDLSAPTITHTPIADGQAPGVAVTVSATITDGTGVGAVSLYFRAQGGATFGAANMTRISGDLFSAQIPAFVVNAPAVEYYIEATDTSPSPNTGRSPSGAPTSLYRFRVGSSDVTGPTITHTPIGNGQPEATAIVVAATITDDIAVQGATLYYRVTGAGAYTSVAMSAVASTYSATIPAGSVTTAGVQYYVRAEDTSANATTSPAGAPTTFNAFTVTAVDSAAPVISHTPIANGQPLSTNVTVNATITDAGTITATLYYRPIGFPFFSNIPLTSGGGGAYSAVIPGFSVTAAGVEYYITAIDNSSNSATSPAGAPGNSHRFTTTAPDATAPTITHTPVTAGAQGVAIAIRATITDATGIATATLQYRTVGAPTFTAASMTDVGGGVREAVIAAGAVLPAGVEYYIEAVDSSPAANSARLPAISGVFAIAVTASDVTGPNLTVTAPTTWEAIADYVVSADVSDTSGVAQLNLWVRAPAGSWTSYPFPDPSAATRTYRYSTANLAVGQPYMDVYVEAVDNIGNSTVFPVGGAGSPRRVAISYPDIEAPVVTVADPGAQTEGTGFTVEIDATDVSGEVTSVVLYYRRAGSGGWSSVDAVEVGAGSYEADVPGVAVTVGTLEFYATATDDSDNLGISDTRSVSVNVAPDVTAPSISVSAVPNGQPAGTAVTVSATVTDDRGITSVTLRYRAQGGTIFTNLAMTGVGPVYSAQIPAGSVNVPGLEYQVSATDTSANSATSTTFAFTVTAVDAAGPSIAHTPVTSAVEGSNVTLTATVSDSSGVDHGAVVTVVAISGAAPGIISSSWAGDQWTGVLGPVAVGSFGYYLTFSDTLGNVSRSPSSAPGTRHTVNVTPIVVADVTAPTIVTDSIVTPQMEGIDVTVVATVTDASGVDTVTLFYANESDVDFTGVEMTPIGGNRFRAAMLASNLEVGRVDFFVEASDTVGNTGTDPSDAPESVYAFEVEGLEPVDTTPPVIVHVPVDTAPSGVRLRVEAVITDATGVAGATLYAREAGEASFVTFAMTGVGGNVWYADVPVFLTRGSAVEYYVASTDSSPAANRGVAPDGAPAAVFETTFEVVGDDVGSDTVDGDTAGDAGDDAEVDADVADTSDDAADTVDDVEVSDASDAASDTDADLDTIETDTATDAADDSQDDAQDDAVSTDIGTDATGDTTADAGTDSDGGSESDGTGSESDVDDGTDGGGAAGGCASTRPAGGAWVLGFLALVLMRRRRKA